MLEERCWESIKTTLFIGTVFQMFDFGLSAVAPPCTAL